ncbi:PQQ-binding-like beta-propeller repeat protein, partial [Streptomyces sp. 2MCAF27]
ELGRASQAGQAGQADGLSVEADWLPEPVTAEITRKRNEPLSAPLSAPTGQTTAEVVPPTVRVTVSVPGPSAAEPTQPESTPGGKRRVFTRGRVVVGLAVAAVLAVIVTVTLLPGGNSGDKQTGKQTEKQTEKPRAPVLRQLWSSGQGTDLSPVVKDGTVYAGDRDRGMYALDADTGDQLWENDQTTDILSSATVTEGVVSFSSGGFPNADTSRVYALDADTGRRLWKFKPDDLVSSAPVMAGGTAYFYSNSLATRSSTLYALDAETGEKRWSRVISLGTALAFDDGVLYYGAHTVRGSYLHALDADTGKQLWKVHISADILPDPLTSLTVAHGVVHVVGEDGILSARDADNGDLLWKYRTGLSDFSDSKPPVVADGVVYISGNSDETDSGYGQVFAVNAKDGKMLWKYRMPQVSSPPTVTAGTVYVSTEAGALYLLDADSGDSLGQARLANDHEPKVTVADGVAYFDGGDGRLRAARITR